jgi:hypothetical protein
VLRGDGSFTDPIQMLVVSLLCLALGASGVIGRPLVSVSDQRPFNLGEGAGAGNGGANSDSGEEGRGGEPVDEDMVRLLNKYAPVFKLA